MRQVLNTSEVCRAIWVVQMLLSHLTKETEAGKNEVVTKTIQPVKHEGRTRTQDLNQAVCPYKQHTFLVQSRSKPRACSVLKRKEAYTEGPWEAGVERLCHPSRLEDHIRRGS